MIDTAWAAGLFEGEGCIFGYPAGHPQGRGVRLHLRSTDLDVLERFRKVVGVGYIHKAKKYKPHHKDCWVWATGSFEEGQHVIAMLWRWLGERRQSKAHDVLTGYRSAS